MFDDLRLRAMVSANIDPQLTEDEIVMLLETHEVAPKHSLWAASTEYAVGQVVVPQIRNGYTYKCIQAGTSDTTAPQFVDDLSEITDGSVVWQKNGTEVAHNLTKAAAKGWLLKAGKVANRVDLQQDVTRLARDQQYKHCMDQYKIYSKGSPMSIPLVSPTLDAAIKANNIP